MNTIRIRLKYYQNEKNTTNILTWKGPFANINLICFLSTTSQIDPKYKPSTALAFQLTMSQKNWFRIPGPKHPMDEKNSVRYRLGFCNYRGHPAMADTGKDVHGIYWRERLSTTYVRTHYDCTGFFRSAPFGRHGRLLKNFLKKVIYEWRR